MERDFFKCLTDIVGEQAAFKNEPMSRHTTFRAGGEAAFYVMPGSEREILELTALCAGADMPFYLTGGGSNLLVRDEGYAGVIVSTGSRMCDIRIKDTTLTAQAGAKLSQVSSKACLNGLSGLEFAHGIPGTAGGAVVMNAGAYGGEIKDVIKKAKVADRDGNVFCLSKDELKLGYRSSVIPDRNLIVLEAEFELTVKDPAKIKERADEFDRRRRERQPLDYPSAGSTFKRPEGYYAGKLIEDAGMKGHRRGGAMVSEKHAGFVINYDRATAEDILNVIDDVRREVKRKFGVTLETEIKIL